MNSQNNFRTSPQKFKENIKKLISQAKEFSPEVIFIGPTPVDEAKTTPVPWDENKFYKNDYLHQYDEIIKSVCQENKILFVEIFNQWIQTDFKQLLDQDGLHPNSKGHEKIFEAVKDFLEGEKLI